MKITIYELMGLVKDGKAPKKIKFNYSIYENKWSNAYQEKCYVNGNNYRLWENLNLNSNLNDEVEIIEEDKKIEKLETYKEKKGEDYFANILKLSPNSECEIDEALSTTIDKLNELIDEINNLKEND